MTLTLPSIVPANYVGTAKDFLACKVDRSGALRSEYFTVSVPGTTAGTTVIGLVPFQKGFRLHLEASIFSVADLDTSTNVTIDLGYTYYDSTLGTSSGAAFCSAGTTPQAGGKFTLIQTTESNVVTWVAATYGWITATLGASATTTTGNIYGQVVGSYDIGG